MTGARKGRHSAIRGGRTFPVRVASCDVRGRAVCARGVKGPIDDTYIGRGATPTEESYRWSSQCEGLEESEHPACEYHNHLLARALFRVAVRPAKG